MADLYQNVLRASFHGSIVIAAVLLLRLVLKKTPKKFLCLLWLLAGLRLLMPFEIRSDLSLQPSAGDIPYVAEVRQELPQSLPETRPQLTDSQVLPVSPEVFVAPEFIPEGEYEKILGQREPENLIELAPERVHIDWMELIPWVWLAVACCFGVYTLFAYVALKVQVRDAIKIPGGWESDRIDTAFILGFIRPQIYIPMGMPGFVRRHILAHERTHLEKGDHWFKLIGFLALAIHWFNPLVWVAYTCLCKDIEMACDERVVQFMNLEERKQYSAALLTCSVNKTHFAACPVAFGEVSVKERIKTVLNYKKPGFWISLLGVIAIVFVAVCLVTSPAEDVPVPSPETTEATESVNVVNVKNPDELISAIASNTEIVLEAGTYILSEASAYGRSDSEYYTWREVYDGYQLTLTGVENLTIRGSGVHVTLLETDPRYANVIAMSECVNVVLEDFTAGHTRNRGECGGGVIDLEFCDDIIMNQLGLYGCGVVGLSASNCDSVVLADSDIYDCSSSAVRLWSSRDVAVRGCRMYRIGDGAYGGYTFFDIYNSSVLIDDNQLSDSDLNCLMATESSTVTLKNNLFVDNRPQGAVFSGSGVSITMEGNRFENNTIRSWYAFTETAKDKNGKILSEEELHEMYGTKEVPSAPSAPQLEIHVSTVDEFIAAIGPDKDIVLDAPLYDLSTATGYGTSTGEYYYWEDIFDGPGLIIQNVDNMTIRTSTGDKDKHSITAVPRYADVLTLKACSNVILSGFTAGHTEAPGSCAGGVLEFRDSDSVTVDGCGLFGCGIVGVQADYCSGLTVKNTEIYECSQGGIQIWNVDGITVENVAFRDIGGRNTIYLNSCKNATVDGRKVIGVEMGHYEESTLEQKETLSLQAAVNDFANSYLHSERETMQVYLAKDYEPEPWVSEYECSNLYWLEITYEHVKAVRKAGSLVFEVPFREWNGEYAEENDIRYLLLTIIEENGVFKVSNCTAK